ncbi:hypothetical protein [Sorangium sp. So ce1024]|uniref:hypothetical protein n=1 Tax=Sorangium sp. So ce1024 TaxID=3133327 RepID=UPI003EFD268C
MIFTRNTQIRFLTTAGAMLLALAACGGDDSSSSSNSGSASSTTSGTGAGTGTGGAGGDTSGEGGAGGDTSGEGGAGGDTSGEGGAGGDTSGEGGASGDGGAGGAPAAATTWADVEPILKARCAPCHTTPGMPSGGFTISYESSQTDAEFQACARQGLSRGACSLVRVRDGSMPSVSFGMARCTGDPARDGGNASCLTAEEHATLAKWVEGGELR